MKLALLFIAFTIFTISPKPAYSKNIPTHEWLLQTVGDMYVGRPVDNIVERYGVPHSQQNLGGQLVYIWEANTSMEWRKPVVVTTRGNVGDSSRYPYTTVPYIERTTVDSYETQKYHCRLQVYVTPEGIISTLGFYGKMGACAEFNPYD